MARGSNAAGGLQSRAGVDKKEVDGQQAATDNDRGIDDQAGAQVRRYVREALDERDDEHEVVGQEAQQGADRVLSQRFGCAVGKVGCDAEEDPAVCGRGLGRQVPRHHAGADAHQR